MMIVIGGAHLSQKWASRLLLECEVYHHMRYRDVSDLGHISRDAAAVVDFIGQEEYRGALEKIGHSLNTKGFVTPFDDAMFALELDLLNLEALRTRSSGTFNSLPQTCHEGVNFLIGLGQTIPALSAAAKARALGRLRKGLQEGLWPLQHELRVAANLSKRGWDIQFHDLEEGSGFDSLVTMNEMKFEVETKAISAFTGWPIKPENLNKLLVEVKENFEWQEENTIPLLGLKLSSNLLPDRSRLRLLVSACSEVARTREELSICGAKIRFMDTVPNLEPEKLTKAAYIHSQMTRKIVLVNPTPPRLVLELDSDKPVQLERKIVKTINEASREQFSRKTPGVIWTHVKFIPNEVFTRLCSPVDGHVGFFDRVANGTLLSEKRNHVSQLVFSGGSFLDLRSTPSTACSSYRMAVYDSPACRFGEQFIFPGGRKKPSAAPGHNNVSVEAS